MAKQSCRKQEVAERERRGVGAVVSMVASARAHIPLAPSRSQPRSHTADLNRNYPDPWLHKNHDIRKPLGTEEPETLAMMNLTLSRRYVCGGIRTCVGCVWAEEPETLSWRYVAKVHQLALPFFRLPSLPPDPHPQTHTHIHTHHPLKIRRLCCVARGRTRRQLPLRRLPGRLPLAQGGAAHLARPRHLPAPGHALRTAAQDHVKVTGAFFCVYE